MEESAAPIEARDRSATGDVTMQSAGAASRDRPSARFRPAARL
jgi:hypothetical protein